MNLAGRALGWGIALLSMLAVFLLYLRPEFIVDLAQQLWSCF